jgi:2-dehydropantoate 2-reductase
VLGAGAIGCLFSCALHRGGCTTTLLLRDTRGASSHAVIIESGGESSTEQLAVTGTGEQGAVSHLLVTTKAYDVLPAVAAVAHRLDAESQVLLLANGMGFGEEVQRDFPHLDIYCGTTTEGAYRIAAQHIRHAGRGTTRIGKTGLSTPPSWFSQWSRAVPDSLWDSDIEQALWQKLAINCVINPLTAVHRCNNGELARQGALSEEVRLLCDEIAAISSAAGFAATAQTLHESVAQVIAGTAANRSSMLQDVLAGRRTEIDYITGYLLTQAGRHGIAAPHNRDMLQRVENLVR